MRGFGALKNLEKDMVRIQARIEREFERVDAEDRE